MHNNIDLKKINRWVLHKHRLTRASKSKKNNLVDVVKDICGLHAQVASTPYLSLWNRINNFQKEDLGKELYERRTLVKIWSIRATLHIVHTEHVVEYYFATRKAGGRRPLILEPGHKKILKILDDKGPLAAQELAEYIVELRKKIQTQYGNMTLGQIRLRELSQATILVPVKPKGDWKSNLHTYASFKTWLPSINLEALDEREAKKKVILHYLSGFGAATADDIAWWIGIAKGEISETLKTMDDEVEIFTIPGLEGKYYARKSDLEHVEKFVFGEDSVHLLPKFDPFIMGYKNRQRLIDPLCEKKVYWSTRGEGSPVILFNGRIIGTWNHKEENNKITVTLSFFEKANKILLNLFSEQAEKIIRFMGKKHAEIVLGG